MIIKLNKLRKADPKRATKVSKQWIDAVLISSAVPINTQDHAQRQLDLIDDYLKVKLGQ